MHSISSRCILLLTGTILFLSCIILLINHFIFKFSGNNYIPENTLPAILLLIISNIGLYLCFKKNSKICQSGREVLYFFTVMLVIAFATNAVQLTPFSTIDSQIISFETLIHLNMSTILKWTAEHPHLQIFLAKIYDSLPYQMSLLPILAIISGRFYLLREYYFLLLCTTIFGFGFYYFFPTTAPASIINSPLFASNQIATGLKFNQIHQHIMPTTNEGGLIALPSFHVIWGLLCVNLLKEWSILYILLLSINIFLIASCVLLGWHYCTDIAGSLIVLLLSYYFLVTYKSYRVIRPERDVKLLIN